MPVSPALLHQLLATHGSVLELMAAQWCDEAEDCVQEGVSRLAALERPPDSPQAWLYRVVRNEAISRGRRSATRRRHEQSAGRRLVESWFARQPRDSEITPEQAVEALAVLDSEALELVLLRIWGRLTLQEIAAATDVGVATVHRRYRLAIAQLKSRLESTCQSPIE